MRTLFAISISIAVLSLGCTAAPATLREPDTYEGCGTDENWRTFDEKKQSGSIAIDDRQAPSFTSSVVDGMTIPLAMKPTFQWQPTPSITGKKNGDASCSTVCTLCGGMTPCTLCGEHDAPVSGDVYDLQFSAGDAVVYRVITTLQFFTPDDAVWMSWKGQTVSLSITRMHVELNELKLADDGPWRGTKPLAFKVGS